MGQMPIVQTTNKGEVLYWYFELSLTLWDKWRIASNELAIISNSLIFFIIFFTLD